VRLPRRGTVRSKRRGTVAGRRDPCGSLGGVDGHGDPQTPVIAAAAEGECPPPAVRRDGSAPRRGVRRARSGLRAGSRRGQPGRLPRLRFGDQQRRCPTCGAQRARHGVHLRLPRGSRSLVGSSRTRTCGCAVRAAARTSRCFWPPESAVGMRRPRPPSPVSASAASTRRRISSRARPRFSGPNAASNSRWCRTAGTRSPGDDPDKRSERPRLVLARVARADADPAGEVALQEVGDETVCGEAEGGLAGAARAEEDDGLPAASAR